MDWKIVSTQAEFNAAFKAGFGVEVQKGYFEASGSAQVRAYDSAQVRAYDSAQVRAYGRAQVTAYGSAQVRAYGSAQVRAYDSAQVTASGSAQVTASGSAQVTASGSAQVRAYDSAQVRAYDSAQVRASDSAQVTASEYVAVTFRAGAKVKGGVKIKLPSFKNAKVWCQFYSVNVVNGIATVFKSVLDDYRSPRGTSYANGETPVASDWDGGKEECGGGLHFSPTPMHALSFHDGNTFVACKVKLSDMRAPQKNDKYPEKIKAKGCCAPCQKCDINGKLI